MNSGRPAYSPCGKVLLFVILLSATLSQSAELKLRAAQSHSAIREYEQPLSGSVLRPAGFTLIFPSPRPSPRGEGELYSASLRPEAADATLDFSRAREQGLSLPGERAGVRGNSRTPSRLLSLVENAELSASAGVAEGSPTEAGGQVLTPAAVTNQAKVRFEAADIYVDSKNRPLAAYQLELSITGADAKIVGIEGGEAPAFSNPPFYDPKAMQHERVVIAAFSTNDVAQLPTGKVRVATIHLETSRSAKPEFQLKLHAAASLDGVRIPAEASVKERQTQ